MPVLDRAWHCAVKNPPPDHRQVLGEVKPRRKNQKSKVFTVACYHRPLKGVHDCDEPGWFQNEGDEVEIVRWQHIDAVVGP
jgi:hypothetical protein